MRVRFLQPLTHQGKQFQVGDVVAADDVLRALAVGQMSHFLGQVVEPVEPPPETETSPAEEEAKPASRRPRKAQTESQPVAASEAQVADAPAPEAGQVVVEELNKAFDAALAGEPKEEA